MAVLLVFPSRAGRALELIGFVTKEAPRGQISVLARHRLQTGHSQGASCPRTAGDLGLFILPACPFTFNLFLAVRNGLTFHRGGLRLDRH